MEQAPGPRGSPQVPQAPRPSALPGPRELPVTAENVERSFSSFALRHEGHWGRSRPKTRVSNSWSHSLQRNSKIGIRSTLSVVHAVGAVM